MKTWMNGILCGLLMCGTTSAEASLVAYWQADGGFYDSAGGHDGIAHNGVAIGNGLYGGAFSFDGINDYIEINDAGGTTSLNMSYLTVAMWIKPAMATSSGFGVFTLDKRNSGAYTGEFTNLIRGNGAYQVAIDTTGTNAVVNKGSVPGIIPMNQWSHLAWTWDGSLLTVYLNANPIATANGSGTMVNNPSDLIIGARADICCFYKGLIDEIKVYDHALSASEIASALQPIVTPVPLPAAFWSLLGGLVTLVSFGTRRKSGNL